VQQQEDIQELHALIQGHLNATQSVVAKKILDNWKTTLTQFVKVYPTDYRLVLEEANKAKEGCVEGASSSELIPRKN
jgi:glutamate synthase domain-containing protein 3